MGGASWQVMMFFSSLYGSGVPEKELEAVQRARKICACGVVRQGACSGFARACVEYEEPFSYPVVFGGFDCQLRPVVCSAACGAALRRSFDLSPGLFTLPSFRMVHRTVSAECVFAGFPQIYMSLQTRPCIQTSGNTSSVILCKSPEYQRHSD